MCSIECGKSLLAPPFVCAGLQRHTAVVSPGGDFWSWMGLASSLVPLRGGGIRGTWSFNSSWRFTRFKSLRCNCRFYALRLISSAGNEALIEMYSPDRAVAENRIRPIRSLISSSLSRFASQDANQRLFQFRPFSKHQFCFDLFGSFVCLFVCFNPCITIRLRKGTYLIHLLWLLLIVLG